MRRKKEEKGFIMPLWSKIFSVLSKISIFELVRRVIGDKIKNKFKFVEVWVIMNLILSIGLSILVYNIDNVIVNWIVLAYAISRVFEIIVYQINVIVFDPYRSEMKGRVYRVKSISRMVVLLIHNYFEIIFWYVLMTIVIIKFNNLEIVNSWAYFFKASFLCLATFNGDLIIENGIFLNNIVFIEIFSGVILTIVSIARFIGILPEVKEMR